MAEMPRQKLSVLIPVYNEAAHICENLRETARVLEGFWPNFELVVSDDGSRDDSYSEALRAAAENPKITVVRNPVNEGKGYALKTAFARCTGELIVFLDADLDLHPQLIRELLDILERTGADVVIGSKFHPQSKLDYPLHRRILSHIYATVLWALFSLPLHDTQTGLKLYKRSVLDRIFPRIVCRRYAFDVELLANAFLQGYKVVEAPVVLQFRRERKWGRIGLKAILLTAQDTLAIFYRYHVLNYYRYERPPLVSTPLVSVVIPTQGDSQYLRESVRATLAQDYPVEVIVVSDQAVEALGEQVRVIVAPGLSPPRKRDMGTRLASGEIVAFLDDDAFPAPGWLRAAARHFRNPDIQAVGGPGATHAADSVAQRASGVIYASVLVSGSKAFRYIPKSFQYEDDHPSCNLFIRRSLLEELGGFDCDYYPGEDSLLCKKLIERGIRIFYDPEAMVYHHRRPLFTAHLRQIGSYAFQRGYFARTLGSVSLRLAYFLPTLWLLWLLFGWAGSFIIPRWYWFYGGSLALYLLCAALSAIRHLDPKLALYVFPGIILSHLTYGVCFLLGFLSRRGLTGSR